MGLNDVRLTELGFADFTALLISQTLDAIIAAQLDQEKKIAEIQRSVRLSSEEFALQFLSGEAARNEIIRLFAVVEKDIIKSAVDAGMSYKVLKRGKIETPAVLALTGYKMAEGDWAGNSIENAVITEQGYENIENAVRISLANRQQEFLAIMLNNGMPRVFVDYGRISAKLTINFDQSNRNSAGISANKLVPQVLSQGLRVKPVNTSGPEFFTLKTNITSEIEINFKTLIT
jgi:hypothetical protein